MPKRKSKPVTWYDHLDPAKIEAALEDATVDSKDEEEQLSGLFYAMEEDLKFPWQGRVLVEAVTVVGIEMLEPFPDGHLYLAAYLQWKQML